MSFTALMGLEDYSGYSDFAIKKLSEAVKVVINVASIGQLLNEPTEEAAALQTVAEEMILASAEVSTLPRAPLLLEEPTVPTEFALSREKVPATECIGPDEQPMLVDQSMTT